MADVTTVSELVQCVRHGEEFDVILLGGSTCSQIDLVEIATLAAAVPQTPILVAAECDSGTVLGVVEGLRDPRHRLSPHGV